MRINKYLALATGVSRRTADAMVADGRVDINGTVATAGQQVNDTDSVTLDRRRITPPVKTVTILLHKPVGYICSRNGQGSKTVYALLPSELHELKSVGRLDKDSSGLLLMTTDGQLAHQLTHPRYKKEKIYEVKLNKPLSSQDQHQLKAGVTLDDGLSTFSSLMRISASDYQVSLHEGRNRQIRRTFEALGYGVIRLHRIQFGSYQLSNLPPGSYIKI